MLYKMVLDPTAWNHKQTSRNSSKKRIIDGHFHLRFNICFFQRVFGINELFPWILSKMQVLTLYQVIAPTWKDVGKNVWHSQLLLRVSDLDHPIIHQKGDTRRWFHFFFYSPLFGEDSHFDSCFWNGLKPATRDMIGSYMSKHVIMSWFLYGFWTLALPSGHGEESLRNGW